MSLVELNAGFEQVLGDALELDVKYENMQKNTEHGVPFGAFMLGAVEIERQAQGKCDKVIYMGVATLEIRVPIKEGSARLFGYVDTLITYIMNNGLAGGIKFIEPPQVGESIQEFDWFNIPVSIPYTKDNI